MPKFNFRIRIHTADKVDQHGSIRVTGTDTGELRYASADGTDRDAARSALNKQLEDELRKDGGTWAIQDLP